MEWCRRAGGGVGYGHFDRLHCRPSSTHRTVHSEPLGGLLVALGLLTGSCLSRRRRCVSLSPITHGGGRDRFGSGVICDLTGGAATARVGAAHGTTRVDAADAQTGTRHRDRGDLVGVVELCVSYIYYG